MCLDRGWAIGQTTELQCAPQLGFAWDPMKNGKTSIRGGIGLFYENAIWNNVFFDGPNREPTGAFLQFFHLARHRDSRGTADWQWSNHT